MTVSAEAMHRVLIDHARARGRAKRGGGWQRVLLDDMVAPEGLGEVDIIALNDALDILDLAELGEVVKQYLDQEYQSLKTEDGADPQPTAGFQRVIQRAILHVQSSGKDTVTGANVLVALFSERDSYAVYFLQQQDMSLTAIPESDVIVQIGKSFLRAWD